VDPARTRVFLPAFGGRVEAVDVGSGQRIWHSPAGAVVAGAGGDRVVAWEPVPGVRNKLRVAVLDAATGRTVVASEPVVLPEWAATVVFTIGGEHLFWAAARVERDAVLLSWEARAQTWGGPQPTRTLGHATGVAAVDPATGKVTPADRKPGEELSRYIGVGLLNESAGTVGDLSFELSQAPIELGGQTGFKSNRRLVVSRGGRKLWERELAVLNVVPPRS
jgi:hypothetical protein